MVSENADNSSMDQQNAADLATTPGFKFGDPIPAFGHLGKPPCETVFAYSGQPSYESFDPNAQTFAPQYSYLEAPASSYGAISGPHLAVAAAPPASSFSHAAALLQQMSMNTTQHAQQAQPRLHQNYPGVGPIFEAPMYGYPSTSDGDFSRNEHTPGDNTGLSNNGYQLNPHMFASTESTRFQHGHGSWR